MQPIPFAGGDATARALVAECGTQTASDGLSFCDLFCTHQITQIAAAEVALLGRDKLAGAVAVSVTSVCVGCGGCSTGPGILTAGIALTMDRVVQRGL